MQEMNRKPPKNVYRNNRLKKIELPAQPINNKHQSCHQYVSGANIRCLTEANASVDTKDRSLRFDKSQSKYTKHFEPTSFKALASQTLNEHCDVKKALPNLITPSTLGDLGIPLKHCYVQRKGINGNHQQSLQPVSKKSRKNLERSALQEDLFCTSCDQSVDSPLRVPFQESPNQLVDKMTTNDPHNASEFFQMVKATIEDTFEEVVKDCPEFLTTTLSTKENLLKKLRSYTQKQQVVGDHSNMEDMSTSGSDNLLQSTRMERFTRFPEELSTESYAIKPKPQLNDTAATTMATHSWTPAAYCFKTYSTPCEILPRSRRDKGSATNVNERMPSDRIQISSKGSSVQVNGSFPLSQTCCKNNEAEMNELADACLPMPNPRQVPSFPLYPNVYGNWSGFM